MAVAPSLAERLTELGIQFVGLALLAGVIALVAAFLYRWYVRERIPWGLALLLGLAGVAAYLNTTTVLGEIISGSDDVTQAQEALFNIGAFGAGAVGARLGRRSGDGFADALFGEATVSTIDEGVGRVVKAVGRVVTVELPEEIDDVVGYDPVSPATKQALAGRRFLFPRGLTVDELRSRLVTRIKADYAVGHVDVEVDADGTVGFLAVASRAAGIGPTLAPATKAIALRADPAFAASAGDVVQVWAGSPPERLFTAELRGVAGDVVTLAIDAADVDSVDQSRRHRLVTLPIGDRTDREFASILRAADETHTAVTVQSGSPIEGLTVGSLDVTVLGVTSPGSQPDTLPPPSRIIAAGDVVNAIARPEALRRLEAAAAGPVPDASAPTTDDR